jgi:predicted nucleotidyltransferase
MSDSPIDLPLEALAALCQRYSVHELAVFGSTRRGDFGPRSDIDLLVEFEPDALIGFMALSRMQRELTALLGRRVDLVPKAGLKALIRQHVLDEVEVLYAA